MPGEPEGQSFTSEADEMVLLSLGEGSLLLVEGGRDELTVAVEDDYGQADVQLTRAQVRDLIPALQQWLAQREGMG